LAGEAQPALKALNTKERMEKEMMRSGITTFLPPLPSLLIWIMVL
jgi:hypothetical protein